MYRMLLVDDEYMILAGLQKLIPWQELGIEIVGTAKNGQEALDFVRNNVVDIVISDVTMPLLSGIEFIRQAQSEDIYFHFLILSGYQEFDYVKEGLRMGADNYLIKPVDKVELIETLEKIIKELNSEAEQLQTQSVLFDYLLQGWTHDDIDYIELRKMIKRYGYRLTDRPYTALIIAYPMEAEEALIEFIADQKQGMYYKQNDDQSYTVIFDGSKEELKTFIKDYQQFSQSLLGDFLIGVGETVNEIVEVASSYEHALHALQIRNFYQIKGLELTKQIETGMIPQLSFTKFNQALYIRDFDTIREEVDMMLEKLRKHGALPEYSRQMIFLIFMDLYRQFENLDESFYQVNFEKIATAQSFEGLESVIEETLLEIKHVKKERSYSQNTQHMLEIITKRYSEDLSLKVVADELFLNVMYLGQIFKKETQKSFSQYLNQYRIKKAQNLLVQSDGNINEIAIAVGYTSAGYFYKNFKKICGISPKEFRERFENSYDPIDS